MVFLTIFKSWMSKNLLIFPQVLNDNFDIHLIMAWPLQFSICAKYWMKLLFCQKTWKRNKFHKHWISLSKQTKKVIWFKSCLNLPVVQYFKSKSELHSTCNVYSLLLTSCIILKQCKTIIFLKEHQVQFHVISLPTGHVQWYICCEKYI